MKRIKLCLVLSTMIILSLFFVGKIYGVFTKVTTPSVNKITIAQNTSYTVVHEIMNLDGTTYTEYSRDEYTSIPIGTTVSPTPLTIEGYNTPSVQTVTLNSYEDTVITYRYPRKQYTLTINNSNYVTTTTPSGTYYHGQVIHLVAAPADLDGNPFVKWSNNVTTLDYTFTMTSNVTIEPRYAENYIITYHPNNGESLIITTVSQNHSLQSVPTVTNDDCVGATGDYQTRQCTYVYKFEGWYTELTYENQVNADYVPTEDTNLYAKWNKIYYGDTGSFTCTGSNYIDTGVKLFTRENAEKNFLIKFTVDQNKGYSSGDRGSIFTNMHETGEPYPGVHFFSTNNTNYTMNINTTGSKVKNNNTGYVTGQSVAIKKENGLVYYSYDGGAYIQINNFQNFNTYFDDSASFCAGINAQGNRYRFFKGSISNMSVEIIDLNSYTIHFDSNGGTGMMLDQSIKVGQSTTINENTYTKYDNFFGGWNTSPDGTGTSYPDNYSITSDLGTNGDVITLYAPWIPAEHFTIHYDANGGTGTMTDQRFTINTPAVPLTTNAFTRTNYEFRGWNTASDGSGTHYSDEQAVANLTNVDEDIVTLYAEWWKIQYSHPGDIVFDGTINTFINTGINVFNNDNYSKDFEIRFTFKSVDSDVFTYTPKQPTIFNVKDESNNKYPGFNVRIDGKIDFLNPTYRWGGSTVTKPSGGISTANAPITFIYRRKNNEITLQYSYENFTSQELTLFNQTSWTLNMPFSTNIAFGGYFDGTNQPGRFFKGTLADLIVLMDD